MVGPAVGWGGGGGRKQTFARNSSLLCIPPAHSACVNDNVRTVFIFASDNFIRYNQKGPAVAMRTYTLR